MSTEQEISFMHLVEVKRDLEKQVRELTHRLDIALEYEVACAEQRQRADMAEEREKGLRTALEEILEVSFQLRLEPHMEEIIDIARGSLEEEEADNVDNRHLLSMAEKREDGLRSNIIRLSRDVAESPALIDSRDLMKRLMGILDA